MKINSQIFFTIYTVVMLFLISGCGTSKKNVSETVHSKSIENTEIYGELFIPRCVQRETSKGTPNAENWCRCYLNELKKTNRSIDDMHYACNLLKLKPEEEIKSAESNCKKYDLEKKPMTGDIVEQYRTYRGGKWLAGVPKKDNGIVWKISKFENNRMYLELLHGDYWGKPVGHITYKGDPEYSYYNPGSTIYEGVLKSFRVCSQFK